MEQPQYTPDQVIAIEQVRHLMNTHALLANERAQLLAAANRIAEIDALMAAITGQVATIGSRLPQEAKETAAE